MKDEKQDDHSVNEVDRVIYDYLDEMLHDSAAGDVVPEQSPLTKVVPDNVAHFDVSRVRQTALTESAPVAKPPSPERVQSKPYSVIERPALLSDSLLTFTEKPAEKFAEPSQPDSEHPPAGEAPPETALEVTPDEVTHNEVTPEVTLLAVEEEGPGTASGNQWCDNGRPSWAQSRFECLIFSVNGLKLAVPLITLGSIHQIDRKFNALPGQYDWFIGILQTQNSGNIKVLDTGLCVMPERYDPASRETLAYVITIHGYPWGLACHEVERSITLEPEQVKWRTQRGKRPWLAGTVLEHMCSLVDTDGFQEIIAKAEQSL